MRSRHDDDLVDFIVLNGRLAWLWRFLWSSFSLSVLMFNLIYAQIVCDEQKLWHMRQYVAAASICVYLCAQCARAHRDKIYEQYFDEMDSISVIDISSAKQARRHCCLVWCERFTLRHPHLAYAIQCKEIPAAMWSLYSCTVHAELVGFIVCPHIRDRGYNKRSILRAGKIKQK